MEGRLFELIDKQCLPLLSSFEAQNLANLMVAAANLDHELPEEVYTAIAQECTLKMPKANAQGVSNILWAFAKLKQESPLGGDLFRSAFARIPEVSPSFICCEVFNCRQFSTLDVRKHAERLEFWIYPANF